MDAADADLATFFYHLAEAAGPFSNSKQRRLPALTREYLDNIAGFTLSLAVSFVIFTRGSSRTRTWSSSDGKSFG